MSIFSIKLIACFTMILDHIKYAIPELSNFFTLYFGRISFPLFAFLVTEGYSHTKDLRKYFKRLVIFACISQIPFMLFRSLVGDYKMLNILFTLLLGLSAITTYDKIDKKIISIPIVLFIIYLGKILKVDYSWFGVATVFLFYITRNKKVRMLGCFLILVFAHFYLRGLWSIVSKQIIFSYIFTVLPILIIFLYNGTLGRKMKYIFYWFYPLHMLVFYFISFANNGLKIK